jgi:retron-type reverse transcriptase
MTVQKAHSLTGRITFDLMLKAFKAVKKNRGAAGIDKVSIKMFERQRDQNLAKLMKDLKTGAYWPYPLRRKYVPKAPGKFRPLGIPAVRDRVAQEVIRRLIEPHFEPHFSAFSFGFRPLRSCHQAIWALRCLRAQGYRIVLVQHVIEGKLQLKLSPKKTKITTFEEGFDFLGFHFSRSGVTMRRKSVERLKEKIRNLTIRSHNFSAEVILRLNRVTRGVANYYATEFSPARRDWATRPFRNLSRR